MAERKPVFAGSVTSNPGLEPFWDACEQRKLLVPFCRACGRAHWYPRAICPHCFAHDIEWREAKGDGVIYSLSIQRADPPYVIAYVTLEEGPTMLTNIVDADPASLRIGQAVRLRFVGSEDGPPLPVFSP
jgi:uncharacterized protein